jgi:hypothetical protein
MMRSRTPRRAAARPSVPERLMALPADHLACAACGVATADPGEVMVGPLRVLREVAVSAPAGWSQQVTVRLTRCPACLGRRQAAEALAAASPIRRVDVPPRPLLPGSTSAPRVWLRPTAEGWADQHEAACVAAALLDVGERAVADLLAAGVDLRFVGSPLLAAGRCAPGRFAHVTAGNLADARRRYADVLHWRMLASAPPVTLPHPDGGGCLLCGVDGVMVSARAAHTLAVTGGGGVWRRSSLRVAGRSVAGQVCAACAEALDEQGGSAHAAVLAELRRCYPGLPADDPADVLGLAWAARRRPPSAEPWAHLPETLEVVEHDGAGGPFARLLRRRDGRGVAG